MKAVVVHKNFPLQVGCAPKHLSAVAGIIGRGGFRCVVTELWRMQFHVMEGEECFVVPDLWVEEPLAWEMIPSIISRAETYSRRMYKRNDLDPLRC